jgi:hypothetical protein
MAMKRLFCLIALLFASAACLARGLQFAEEMRGYAYVNGEFRNARVTLKVVINDIDAWRVNPNVAASLSGTLVLDRMPAQPVTGSLAILAPAPGDDGRLLTYRMSAASLQYTGVKHVRDQAGVEVFDDMTTLRGLFQPAGQPAPAITDLLYDAGWTSELHFEWWNPSVTWNFAASFSTIGTPWYQDLEVKAIFVKTVLGALARTLFPWAFAF